MLLALMLTVASSPSAHGWQEVGRRDGVSVYFRERERDGNHETLGVGVLAAPPWIVKPALDDVQAKTGRMPSLIEDHVIRRDARGVVVYNRTSAPVIADRDYTLRMFDDSFVGNDGDVVYVIRFHTANDEGPPPRSGVVRVPEIYGEWRLESVAGGTMTRASYFVYVDPGGSIPITIAQWGAQQMFAGVFDAVRTRVKDPAYRAQEPTRPTRVVARAAPLEGFAER